VRYLFAVVRTAALQSLEIDIEMLHESGFAESAIQFLKPSSLTLNSLKLHHLDWTWVRAVYPYPDTLYRLLETVPSLHTLHVSRGIPSGYPKLFSALTASPDGTPRLLCPRLRQLRLTDVVCDPPQLAAMIESRRYPLAEVSFRLFWPRSTVPQSEQYLLASIQSRIRDSCGYMGLSEIIVVQDDK
jgi:hypothetical protein